MKEKLRVFWFHYNKSESKKAGKPKLTVHWKGACHLVDSVSLFGHTWSVVRTRQPFLVIKGYGVCTIIKSQSGVSFHATEERSGSSHG